MKSMPKHVQNVYYRMAPMQNRTIKLLKDLYAPFNMRLSKICLLYTSDAADES